MLCDGKLEVHSEKNKGTEAIIYIPKWGGYYGVDKILGILTKQAGHVRSLSDEIIKI